MKKKIKIITDNIKVIRFEKKPISISPYYRPIYRIAQICLILELSSRSKTASIRKLHYLSWIMRSKNNMKKTMLHINEIDTYPPITVWRWEPSLNRAINLAESEELICKKGGKYSLRSNGKKFIDLIIRDDSLMRDEKDFLLSIGKKISEAFINRIIQLKVYR